MNKTITLTFIMWCFCDLLAGACIGAQSPPKPNARSLIEAVKKNQISRVLSLLKGGSDVNAKDTSTNLTALLAATNDGYHDNINMVILLVARGARVNVRDDNGYTPLLYAVINRKERAILLLLRHRASTLIRTKDGNTVLILIYKVRDGRPSAGIARALIGHHADVNAKDETGDTPLHYASMRDSDPIEHIRVLVKAGAKVNARDSEGNTALMYAVRTNNLVSARYLLERGATVNIRNIKGETALMWSETDGLDCLKLLLSRGADVNVADHGGRTALSIAREHGDQDTVLILQKAGAKK